MQTLQKIATIVHRLDAVTEDVRELRKVVDAGFEKLQRESADMRERLARLEALRDADRAQMQAELARFKAEVERAEMKLARLLPPQGEHRSLPEPDRQPAWQCRLRLKNDEQKRERHRMPFPLSLFRLP